MTEALVRTATAPANELATKLWWVSLLRGLAALALGAYVLSRELVSPAVLARTVAVYWVLDSLVALWASLFAATLAMNRVLLIVRGSAGLAAALIILGLPLVEVFGPWKPGQLLFLILIVTPALAAIGPPAVLAHGLGVVGIAGGLGLVAGTLRLRPSA